jgi:hypothetical protein
VFQFLQRIGKIGIALIVLNELRAVLIITALIKAWPHHS